MLTSKLGSVIVRASSLLGKKEKYTLQIEKQMKIANNFMEERNMNKESILEMSRQENKNKDLFGYNEELKASLYAGIAMAVLSAVIYVAQIVIQGKFDWGLFAVVTVYNAVINFVKGVKTSKKDLIVAGILWAVTTVILLVAHFGTLIAASTIL